MQAYLCLAFWCCCVLVPAAESAQSPPGSNDEIADNMLVYQRSVGGWPKHIGNENIDYTKKLSPAERAGFIDDAGMNDATIDNNATTKEIRYLVKAYTRTENKSYLQAAEKGIRYLLQMQYKSGGFPQFYPDKSLYRSEITYNDNAMVNALNVLNDVALGVDGLDIVDPSLKGPSADAVKRGIACILRTQIRVKGKLRSWCAQYDYQTFQPAKARAYELPSLSGSESVGIVKFLMRILDPSPAVIDAINNAVEWFGKVKIEGYQFTTVRDASQPKGFDRVLRASPGSVIWARFYDIDSDQPFFCGRDGIRRTAVKDIKYERRTGYAWYGEWPRELLDEAYPAWRAAQHLAGPVPVLTPASTRIIVDASGHGDFRTVQEALDSLPAEASSPRTIFIRKGIYREKIFVEKNNIILEGEDRTASVLTFSLARDAWRCDHKDDWGVATLNLSGSDIVLKNLTIQNDFGFAHTTDTTIACAADTVIHKKTVGRTGHQMALRSFATTRLIVTGCILRAYGGDTVSPWNVSDGMFYFWDCVMEGGVDFYCPRGWAYAENCKFIADTGPACIWHDGSVDPDSKTVLNNCSFSGYDGFKLGRYHREAQFFLIHCSFAENMADQDIYLVPTATPIHWGRRIYYYDCHKKGSEYKWYGNNLDQAPGAPAPEKIGAPWVFGSRWDPQKRLKELNGR